MQAEGSVHGDGRSEFCSREDSNLHGLPHTVLSRTRLPVPPRERGGQSYQTNSRSQPGKEFRSYRSSGVTGVQEFRSSEEQTETSSEAVFLLNSRTPVTPELLSSAEPHRHQHVQECPVNLNHARAHLINQIQKHLIGRKIPKRSHQKFRVKRNREILPFIHYWQ